jgi:hypothetical protein
MSRPGQEAQKIAIACMKEINAALETVKWYRSKSLLAWVRT